MSTPAETIKAISRWLNYFFAFPMILFGMVGAILTVLIFMRQQAFWRNPTTIYLLAGAVMTAIHLPSIYLPIILVDSFNMNVFNVTDVGSRVFNYFLYVTTVSAISFPCWAAFDQYAATNREANFRNRWSSMRIVRRVIIGTPIFWMIIYSPVLCVSRISSNLYLSIDGSFTKYINYFLTPLVFTLIPLIVIVCCTQGTIRNLRSTPLTNRHDRFTKQIRRMLIPQLLLLSISGFPFGIESIYLEATGHLIKDELRLAIEQVILQMFRFFYHFNFVFTFYIYLYMSNEVRQALKRLFFTGFQHRQIAPMPLSENNYQTTSPT